MNSKRGQGPGDNPWVKNEPGSGDNTPEPEPELPPSPWNHPVAPPPGQPGGAQFPGTAGSSPDTWGNQPSPGGPAGPGAQTGPGAQSGPRPGEPTGWGSQISPPSLRRPPPEPKRRKVPSFLIPVGAAVVLLALIGTGLVVFLGGDDKPETVPPTPTPAPTAVSTPPPPTYTPPANALQVGFGVSVVPADGWTEYAAEKQGKQVIAPDPNGKARAFFWVRQRQGMTAETYLLRVVEGETGPMVAQLGGPPRNLPCPRDVLVECVAIAYTGTKKGVKLQGYVEAYRRKDGVVTAIDFQSRDDFAAKAKADAEIMKKSVIDSM